ncbi:amylo-alpha-1,6-glucosidase [Fibrobacterota bacterium]
MEGKSAARIAEAKQAALDVCLHNAHGPFYGLPRTAGWGYPEPYTRDLLIAALGFLTSGNRKLLKITGRVLETLAANQSERGHIPSLVHDKEDRGASDTTPLFLVAACCYRQATGDGTFLESAVRKSLAWMEYQSPSDRILVAQQPTSDWRDEQWVMGFGLYVNAVVYSYLRFLGRHERAEKLRGLMSRFTITGGRGRRHVHEGLVLKHKPYYAFWSYKIYSSERFDLLGNSLAILSGLASPSRAREMITWIEEECRAMKKNGELAVDLPPNFFPYIKPGEPEWRQRYEEFNLPGEYHNGGVWPFICGFYIAALVAAGRHKLAEKKLTALTELVSLTREADASYGFNEWHKAQDGRPVGQDWQTWSASMYLYAAGCVEKKMTPFFETARGKMN